MLFSTSIDLWDKFRDETPELDSWYKIRIETFQDYRVIEYDKKILLFVI